MWVCRCVNDRSDTGPPFATFELTPVWFPRGFAIYPVGGWPRRTTDPPTLSWRVCRFRVPEREQHVDQPDQEEEGVEQLERAQHALGQGPEARPRVAQALERAVADGPHPDGHHADRLAAAAAAEDGAVDQVEQGADEEGQGRDAALAVRSPLHHEVDLERLAVAHQEGQDHRDGGEDHEVDEVAPGADAPGGVDGPGLA